MSVFLQVFAIMLTILPTWLAIAILGFISLLVIMIVIKIVAFVLDAIPFL